ncbi:FecR domain-containing protein [Omnitrophica bacterium]|nr:FecR domain-containing protein [Candidatus Omnitrophota bacterium]
MKRITCIATIAVIMSFSFISFADDAVGTFTYVEGRVDLLRSGEEKAFGVIYGEEIRPGDIIRTKSFSRAEITFRDESILRLAPQSRVLLECYDCSEGKRERASLKLYRGKIRAIVSKMRHKTNFFLETPNAAGEIKGSDIMMFYQGGKTNVFAKEGGIKIYNRLSPEESVKIWKGDAITVPLKEPPTDRRRFIEAEMKLHTQDTDPRERFMPKLKETEEMTGWVANAAGPVDIRKSGTQRWRSAEMNEVLGEGDDIKTSEGGGVEIRMDNGNYVSLQPNTEVKLTRLKQDPKTGEYENILESKGGKLKAVIEKLEGKSMFKVKTPTAVCGIRGTVMYLNITMIKTWAFCEGGGGEIESLVSGKLKIIESGHNAYADDTGFVSEPQYTTNDQRMYFDEVWRSGSGAEGYSSPQDNTGEGVAPADTVKKGGHPGDQTHTPKDNILDPFNQLPPEQVKKRYKPPLRKPLPYQGSFTHYKPRGSFFEEAGLLLESLEIENFDGDYYLSWLKGKDEAGDTTDLYLLGKRFDDDTSLLYIVGTTYPSEIKTFFGGGIGTGDIFDGGLNIDGAVINREGEHLYGVSLAFNSLYGWDETNGWGQAGNTIGLTKLSSSASKAERWAGHEASLHTIGELILTNGMPESFLWFNFDEGGHPFSSHDPLRGKQTTLDEAAYYGSAGGIGGNGWIFGDAKALFVTPVAGGPPPVYNAGILFVNNINGLYSDSSDIFGVEGKANAVQIKEDIGVDPELLYVEGNGVVMENGWESGNMNCPLPYGGSISGPLYDHVNISIIGEDWGIWDSEYHLNYVPNGDRWWYALGSGEFVDDKVAGAFYYNLYGYHLTDEMLDMGIIGVTLRNGVRTFFAGDIACIYADYLHGFGTGVYFDESFFGDFTTPYNEVIYDGTVLIPPLAPPGTSPWRGSFMTAGGPGGWIDVRRLAGGDIRFQDIDGRPSGYGLTFFETGGRFSKPPASITGWRLPIGGYGYRMLSPLHPATVTWFGVLEGESCEDGALSGTFEGLRFSLPHGIGSARTSAGVIGGSSGDELAGGVVGSYIEGEDYEWDAICASEWVEVTDLLDRSIFDTVAAFVDEIPITEVHTDILQNGSGSFAAGGALNNIVMDINYYANDASQTLWTALINGDYSGPTSNSWDAGWVNGADQINLVGDLWDDGTSSWHAAVNGTWDSRTINPGSEAGGTFDPQKNTFSGVGVGTWE